MYDVIIIGGGPAGITAAIYCARSNLKVAIIDKYLIGGNPLNYLEIQNYPGLPGTTENLIDKFIEHLDMYDIDRFEFQEIENLDLDNKTIKTTDYDFKYKKLIIATGSKPKMLGVPGENEYIGKGVHYCAICDGPLYKDKVVAVIGGGNSACEEALGLAKICKKVYIIEFTDKLNCEKTTLDKIKNTKNIEVYTGYAVTSIEQVPEKDLDKYDEAGSWFYLNCHPREMFEQKEGVTTLESYPPRLKHWVNGIFVYIGMSPNLPAGDIPELENGYIRVNENMETSIKDIYAIGDITSKKYRQVITAMSDGAIAAIHISKNI